MTGEMKDSSEPAIDVEKKAYATEVESSGYASSNGVAQGKDAVVTAKTWAVVVVGRSNGLPLNLLLNNSSGARCFIWHLILAGAILQHHTNPDGCRIWICCNAGHVVGLPLSIAGYGEC